jgi:hypothetical protein
MTQSYVIVIQEYIIFVVDTGTAVEMQPSFFYRPLGVAAGPARMAVPDDGGRKGLCVGKKATFRQPFFIR